MNLTWLDWLLMLVYFDFVLGIGVALRRKTTTSVAFLGIFMMPFYYGSRARSVPEYLRLRFDEKTRGFNAISFALMTVFSSGISMYAMAKLLQILHIFDTPFAALGIAPGYIFHVCV